MCCGSVFAKKYHACLRGVNDHRHQHLAVVGCVCGTFCGSPANFGQRLHGLWVQVEAENVDAAFCHALSHPQAH